MKIFVSGLTGFVGKNFSIYINSFRPEWNILRSDRNLIDNIEISRQIFNSADIFIHLAGKSHDLKNISKPKDYYDINTELTKKIFDAFLTSNAKVFITLSSVKAVSDQVQGELTEEYIPNPLSHYGKSKLLAEQHIYSKEIPDGKRVYVLRPCIIHGPGNKGNLNLLYKIVSKNIPWPLGAFDNKRSFCSIENLMFVFNQLIEHEDIPSGIYNVADDEALSTNELIWLMAQSQNRKPTIWNITKGIIEGLASIGDKLHLPLNTERLQKLTSSYVVSNAKIKAAIRKPLPVSTRDGLIKTFKSFTS